MGPAVRSCDRSHAEYIDRIENLDAARRPAHANADADAGPSLVCIHTDHDAKPAIRTTMMSTSSSAPSDPGDEPPPNHSLNHRKPEAVTAGAGRGLMPSQATRAARTGKHRSTLQPSAGGRVCDRWRSVGVAAAGRDMPGRL